ncbi:SRPBCC domain-containing protein [Euzebya sp.]|uniref:SRPBCC family protein n=1 Tax=Euzebya sp. TaxID=1971409 RepID=UPI003516B4ED
MLEISATGVVPAPPAAVWSDIADADAFASWYAFCDAVETPEPDVRVLIGSWGAQRSAVTTRVTASDPPRRFAWTHVAETLDGRAAPTLAMDTTVEIDLEPVGDGTEVTITSRQQAAGWWQRVLIRLLGRRKVANMLEQSLTVLAARHR